MIAAAVSGKRTQRRGRLARIAWVVLPVAAAFGQGPPATSAISTDMPPDSAANEVQLTHKPCGHILTNVNAWSSDGKWIVYDTRSDPAGTLFDGRTIEVVNAETREVRTVFESGNGAYCGVGSSKASP